MVEHCFPLTFNPSQPEVFGVEGILGAYQNALQYVTLSGPTLFVPVLSAACQRAEAFQRAEASADAMGYMVLLIITDGVINDMRETKRLLVQASSLPLSVVIIGVGSADFAVRAVDVWWLRFYLQLCPSADSLCRAIVAVRVRARAQAMDELDGDDGVLRDDSGRAAARDLVQFVAMRDYAGNADFTRLQRDVLAEIPRQLVGYYKSRGIAPRPPVVVAVPPPMLSVAPAQAAFAGDASLQVAPAVAAMSLGPQGEAGVHIPPAVATVHPPPPPP